MKVTIYADGGSRGNPGVAGSGTVVYDEAGNTLREIAYVVGQKATNNVAEYTGLLRGLEAARDLGATEVDIYMDSKLVVEQMSGRWKIKHPDMQKLALEAKKIAAGFDTVDYTWVPRNKNKKADELSNVAMDAAAQGAAPGVVGGETPAEPEPAAEPEQSEAPNHEVASHAHWYGIDEAPTRFVLLRHGQTEHSAKHCYSGSSDPVLTEVGQDQAKRAAKWIAQTESIDVIVSSPRTRALETAAAVSAVSGVKVETVEGLREMDFGDFEGKTRDEAVKVDPEQFQAWYSSYSVAPPGGESVEDMDKRIVEVRKQLQTRYAGKTVVVVSHVTPVKSFVRQGLNSGADTYTHLFLDLASISVVEFYPESAVVRRVNDTAHLMF
ncbi:bifunctional RNase H/acid phosphatase [Corynebacterium lubricantis]|uniref:bifunctional RNase H/acid phosphatase n=1 Tax=Corynebacterium lubricantis TaxID=541095 RepID=UPI00037D108C|nr:bifunctional RNase H/acid phosphatase [Corynebacterium lubricantis]